MSMATSSLIAPDSGEVLGARPKTASVKYSPRPPASIRVLTKSIEGMTEEEHIDWSEFQVAADEGASAFRRWCDQPKEEEEEEEEEEDETDFASTSIPPSFSSSSMAGLGR